jgi:hypothetical protein
MVKRGHITSKKDGFDIYYNKEFKNKFKPSDVELFKDIPKF